MKIITSVFLFFICLNASGQLYNTGLIFNDTKYSIASIKANTSVYEDLPTAASLKAYCPKPGNQLQLNTSPSWATAWSASTILEAQKHHWTNKRQITINTYSPAFTYYHIRKPDDESCEAGADLFDALDFLKKNGSVKYMEFLEFCPKGIPAGILGKSENTQITDFNKLFDHNHSNKFKLSAVKKSLSENLPVVVGMYCPPSFYKAKNFWQPKEIVSTDYPGHALCIVGYDDEKYGGAFEVINSWGTRWGNNGFIWIRYIDFLNFTKYAYEVFSIDKSEDGNFDFSGTINLRLNTNEEIKMKKLDAGIFKTHSSLKTGTYFRIYLTNDNPAFLYVFGIDGSNEFFKVFPHEKTISPAMIYKSNEVAIPGEDNYIEIIGEPSQENLCIIYSKEPINFDELLSNLEKYPGNVFENLDALLNGKIVDSSTINWHDSGISFHASSPDRTAIFIQILIDHI